MIDKKYEDWEYSAHKKPLGCPYCGQTMEFHHQIYYEYHTSDWFWLCTNCGLRLCNQADYPAKELEKAVNSYRAELGKEVIAAKQKYERMKKAYDSYGINPSMRYPPLRRKKHEEEE